MNKKVLVSILAMTSASTMTAWADANVDKLKTDDLKDWTKGQEGSDLKLEEGGVIVSPDGADIVKTINLAPGTYRLVAGTLTNAKILFGKTELTKVEGKDYYTFKVTGDAPTDSTLTFKAVNQGESRIGGLTLTLVYDFDANRKVLERQLTDLINTLEEGDKQYETLTQKSSEIAKKIAELEDGKEGAYEAYDKYKMYLGVDKCTLQKDLAEFENDVNAQANNKKAYDAAISLINAQIEDLNDAKSILAGYSNDNGLSDYAKGITSDRLNKAETAIKAAQTQAETAHEGNSAANDLGEAWTTEFNKNVPTLVTEFANAVIAAPKDHIAYRTIGDRIAALKTLQENAVQEILKELTDKDADGNEVYADSRDEAQKELGKVLVEITSIENKKGSDTDHEGVSALYNDNVDNLKEKGTFEVQITEIREEWIAFAQKHKEAYKKAKEAVKGLQDALDDRKKDLEFTQKYDERIQEVQGLIDAHSQTIEADNKEHTIGDKEYNYDDVNNAINQLKGDSQADIDNNKAYLAAVKSVEEAQKALAAAKEEVSKLTSKEVEYSTSGKYTTTETKLQNKLNEISDTIEAHNINLEVESDYTTDFLKEVSSYQTAAEKAMENYVKITKTLAEYNASLDTLKKTALDTNVTIGDGEETYGSRIDAIGQIIKGIQDSFDAAKEKTDDDYNNGLIATLNKLTEGNGIAEEVTSLCASYPGDKAKYDDDIVSRAIVRVLAEATNLVDTQKEELEEIGKKFDDLNENLDSVKNAHVEYDRLKQVIVDQEEAIKEAKEANDATTNTNKAEVLATLQAVQSTLEQNAGEIKKLSIAIDECWNHKQANDGKWNNLKKAEDGRLTKLSSDIESILTEYKDPDRVKEFTDLHNGLSTKYTDLHSEIEASYKAETLIENWEDKTVEEKEIKGFDSQISDLETLVLKAVNDAKASAANRKAYEETKDYYDKKEFENKINDARNNLDGKWAENVDKDAKNHYLSVLLDYEKINSEISKAIKKAYNEDRNSADQKKDLIQRIDDLLEKVKAVESEIVKNKGSYDNLCTTYGNVSAAWTSVYAHISETDKSSESENYLKQLRDLKAQLVDAKSAIDQNYKDGVYGSGNQASIDEGKLRSLEEKINNLKNTQSAGYIAQIEIDNANRHKDFNTTLTAARNEWSAAVDTVGMYSSLTNEKLREFVTSATQEANSKLTEILTQMNGTATAESEDYQKTVAPTLFDKDEKYRKAVEADRAKIQQTLDALDDAVSIEAKTLFEDKLTAANTLLETTCKAIEGITLNDNDIKKAIIEASSDYKVAEGIVEDAKNAFESNDFALVVDKHLTALGTVEGLLASAKEQAAAWEWERFVKDVAGTKAEQERNLDKYTYLANNVRDFKKEYDQKWTGESEGSDRLEEFKKRASEYKQANSLFANVGILEGDLQNVVKDATDIYEDAQTAAGLYTDNLEAYNVLIAQANGLQESLNKAKTYVDAFGCSYLLPNLVSSVQTTLNNVFETLEHKRQYGGCTGDEYKIETDGKTTYDVDKKKTIEGSINKLYSLSYTQELAWLQSQVSDLDGEYNKAYAKNDTAAVKFKDAKDGLQKEVNNYSFVEKPENETQDGLELKSNETIQSDLLKFESDIAKLRSQLLKISAPGNEAAIIESLNGQLNNVRTSYEDKKGDLEDRDLTNEALDAIGKEIEEIQSKIDACEAEDGKILLNQPAIEQSISKVKSDLEGLTGEIDKQVADYEANEAAYADLRAQIEKDEAEFETAKTAIEALITINQDEAGLDIENIATRIGEVKQDLEESHDKTELIAESTVKEFRDKIATILNDIATLLKDYTYEENSNLIKNLQIAINGTKAELINSSNVMNKEDLLIKIDSLATSAQNLSNYNVDAEDGKVKCDIDGNKTEETTVDYVGKASPAISEKLNELKETLAALVDTKDENTYVVGDADGDGNVQVTDYMKVMKLVLGTESVEEGTVNFLRADANGDGKINNGDLVAVVNKILGIRTVDALEQVLATNSMENVGEVKMAAVEGVASKKIAIQLSSTNKYAACQMDVNIPAGVTVTSSSIEGLQNHSLYSAEQTDGTLRLVVSSLENAVMDTEGNATIYLEVEGNNAEAITVSNVTAADVAGATYNIVDKGEATGINGVVSNANSGSLKQRIYSVGGQMMDGVKKGINIIMNSDGTARKVLKK